MKTWKLTLEYDGTKYSGWQEQNNARTVAGALRAAVEDTLGTPIELMGAGRTEFAMSLFGRAYGQKISGRVWLEGKPVDLSSVRAAIDAGLAYVTEDRKLDMMTGRENWFTREGPAAPGFTGYEVLPELTTRTIAYVNEHAAAANAATSPPADVPAYAAGASPASRSPLRKPVCP